jgi:hypothetical protein
MINFDNIVESAKNWDLEVLEVALADATKRAKDGLEIKNIPYTEKQIRICEIIKDEIMNRKIAHT